MKIRMGLGLVLPLCMASMGTLVALAAGWILPQELQAALGGLVPVAAAILLHEGGHMVVSRLFGVPMGELRIDLFGARLHLSGTLSYGREFLIAAAGPLVNLLSAAVVILPAFCTGEDALAWLFGGGGTATFALCSLALAAINLLPVRSLDGGRMMRCLLAILFGDRAADVVLTMTTALCLGGLWFLSVYALLRVGEMLTLFAFSLCLLLRMSSGGGD